MTTNNMLDIPYSDEAEQALIGAVLVNPYAFEQVSTFVSADDFFLLRHSLIWQVMCNCSKHNEPIDYLVVSEALKAQGKLEDIGGYPYLIKLQTETPTSMHAPIYAQLIQRLATRRKLIEYADKLRALALNETQTVSSILDNADMQLIALRGKSNDADLITGADAMIESDRVLRERISMYRQNPDYILGVATGYTDLDQIIDGLPIGITTLAAATGMGKTALELNMALNASLNGIRRASNQPAHVTLFSGEMTQEQLSARLVAIKSGVPVRALTRGVITTKEQYAAIVNAQDSIGCDHKLTFEASKRLSVMDVRNRVRELINQNQIDLYILDGLLQIEGVGRSDSMTNKERAYKLERRRDEIALILDEFEAICATYNTRILLTHQLSRSPGGRADKRPVLSDLAEASFIEQKSSVVMFLYRDEYYNDMTEFANQADVIVAKNRNGNSGTATLYYDKQYTAFKNASVHHVDLSNL